MAESIPRFRRDLLATTVEVDGVRYIDVQDPHRGTSFRFYDFEYDLALQLDGRPASDISAWAVATYGLDLTPSGIAEFSSRLAELGFLEGTTPSPSVASSPALVRAGASGVLQQPLSEEDSAPLSQVVSRAVGAGAQTPIDSLVPIASAVKTLPGMAVRAPSSEMAIVPESGAPRPQTTPAGGVRSSSPTLSAVPRWMAELDTGVARMSGREPPPEPSVGETVMGFAALQDSSTKTQPEPRADAADPIGTVMGFAAVTDQQIREAEHAVGRVTVPPQGTTERRQPPQLDNVVMTPFQQLPDEVHRRQPDPGIRRHARHRTDRSTMLIVVVVALAVSAAVIGYYFWSQREAALEARRVRIVAPRPAAVYRWFDATGSAVVAGAIELSFAAGGSVADVLPPGSRYTAGEIIAKLQGAAAHEVEVTRGRSRVAYHQQIRDSMKAAGNIPEMRRAEIKIVEKQAQLDEAEAALDRLVIRATEPGEVAEIVAARGTLAVANAPAVRVRTGVLRGEFALAARDVDAAAHLGFCRVEIIGLPPAASTDPAARPGAGAANAGAAAGEGTGAPRFADCKLMGAPANPSGKFEVELAPGSGVLLGQPLRLARIRYDGVFPVPRSAVVRIGDTDRLFVVGPGDVAQARAITIADADADEVVISQGIDLGDRVVIDPPADLHDGAPLMLLP